MVYTDYFTKQECQETDRQSENEQSELRNRNLKTEYSNQNRSSRQGISLQNFEDYKGIVFVDWLKKYEEEAKLAGWSDFDLVQELPDHVGKSSLFQSLIKIFPKNVSWLDYSLLKMLKAPESSDVKAAKTFSNFKYNQFSCFLTFFSNKVTLLDGTSFDDKTKKIKITRLLNEEFGEEIRKHPDYDQWSLAEFGLACIELEKTFNWHCEFCESQTHFVQNCPQKMQYYMSKIMEYREVYKFIYILLIFVLFVFFIYKALNDLNEKFNIQVNIDRKTFFRNKK